MKSINRRRRDTKTKRKPLINNLYYFWLLLILLASALIWFANDSINSSNTIMSNKKDGIIRRTEDKIPHYHDYALLFVMYHKTGW